MSDNTTRAGESGQPSAPAVVGDRELLELAAKAAGYTVVPGEVYHVGDDEVDCTDMLWIRSEEPDEGDVYWNPLEDDGDALRLAVKLDIDVLNSSPTLAQAVQHQREWYGEERKDADPCAATRRAIVSAAATNATPAQVVPLSGATQPDDATLSPPPVAGGWGCET